MTKPEFNIFYEKFNRKLNDMIFERVSKLEFFLPAVAHNIMSEMFNGEDFIVFNIIKEDPISPVFEMEICVDGLLEKVLIEINKEY